MCVCVMERKFRKFYENFRPNGEWENGGEYTYIFTEKYAKISRSSWLHCVPVCWPLNGFKIERTHRMHFLIKLSACVELSSSSLCVRTGPFCVGVRPGKSHATPTAGITSCVLLISGCNSVQFTSACCF